MTFSSSSSKSRSYCLWIKGVVRLFEEIEMRHPLVEGQHTLCMVVGADSSVDVASR